MLLIKQQFADMTPGSRLYRCSQSRFLSRTIGLALSRASMSALGDRIRQRQLRQSFGEYRHI